MKKPVLVIVAGNYAQARHYCWLENLNPKSKYVLIASNPYVLRGRQGPMELRYVGTGFSRRDAIEIAEQVAVINATTGGSE